MWPTCTSVECGLMCLKFILSVKYLKTSTPLPSFKCLQVVYLIKTIWDSFMNHMEMVVQFEPGSLILYKLVFDECQTYLIGKPSRSGCSFAFSKTETKAACCVLLMNRRFPEPWNESVSFFSYLRIDIAICRGEDVWKYW